MKKRIKIRNKQYIFYEDELNDDFMKNNHLERPVLNEDYKYIREGKINKFFSNFLYYGIALPILSFVCFIRGIKVVNRKNLKKEKNRGVFIYGNHTNVFDMLDVQSFVSIHKRVNIIGYSDASTIPFIQPIIRSLGYIPIPNNIHLMKKFTEAIEYYINNKEDVLIYPEAHVWPYYTKIRPFKSTSFHYPAKLMAPVLPICTTYTKGIFNKPRLKIIIGEYIYPKKELTERENKEFLRNECYNQMVKMAGSFKQVEYIKYIQTNKEN